MFSVLLKSFKKMKIIIVSSCEDSSMLTSTIIDVEINYNSSLNVIIHLGPIPYFCFLLELYIYTKSNYYQKLQFMTVVCQEMVSINDLKIPMYMYFWLNCNIKLFICLMNVNMISYSLMYNFITWRNYWLGGISIKEVDVGVKLRILISGEWGKGSRHSGDIEGRKLENILSL